MEQEPTRNSKPVESLNFSLSPDEADYSLDVFRKALPSQTRTREMCRLLGSTRNDHCLDLSGGDASTAYWLTHSGGTWVSLAQSESAAAARRRFMGDKVTVFKGLPLEFPDKSFDVAVVGELLTRIADLDFLVTELHRVLKPTGRLVLDVPHARPFSWLRPLQRGMPSHYYGQEFRPGYSERDLFILLKDGFDVQEVRSYSRFFLTLADYLVQRAIKGARIRSDSVIRIKRI